jgi:DNA-binding NarL/FixJ family response regulator
METAPAEPGTQRVVIVDDSEVVRAKLRGLLDSTEGLELIGEAADGETGVEIAARLRPDIVLMDINMPGISGIQATWQLGTSAPLSRVVMLTVSTDQEDVADAIMAGASGYVVKGAADDQIVDSIRRVAAGERVLSPEVAGKLVERSRPRGPERRREVLPEPPAPAWNPPAERAPPPVAAPATAAAPAPAPPDGKPVAPRLRDHLRLTVPLALVVGALLTGANHGELIMDGDASSETAFQAALNVLAAFGLVNVGLLAGSYRSKR